MKVLVQMFARAKDLAGGDTVEVTLDDGDTVGSLRRALAEQAPALAAILPHCLFAVNMEYADDRATLPAGASVACIPPVSGG
ncbi:MAG TPA: MoaD/ThiS family protein [Pirellulales bacterium]|nr:MoaD/ThiS family protein [Pirellulales bacterium]